MTVTYFSLNSNSDKVPMMCKSVAGHDVFAAGRSSVPTGLRTQILIPVILVIIVLILIVVATVIRVIIVVKEIPVRTVRIGIIGTIEIKVVIGIIITIAIIPCSLNRIQ